MLVIQLRECSICTFLEDIIYLNWALDIWPVFKELVFSHHKVIKLNVLPIMQYAIEHGMPTNIVEHGCHTWQKLLYFSTACSAPSLQPKYQRNKRIFHMGVKSDQVCWHINICAGITIAHCSAIVECQCYISLL